MENKKIRVSIDFEIIWKSFHDLLNENEQHQLNIWLKNDVENFNYYQKAKTHFAKNDIEPVNANYQAFKKAMDNRQKQRIVRKSKVRMLLSLAASVLLVISFYFIYTEITHSELQIDQVGEKSVYPEPGKQQAILHFESGEKFILDDDFTSNQMKSNQMKSFSNVSNKSLEYKKGDIPNANPSVNKHLLEVQRGGEFKITLSDGTKVWINSESILKYPVNFGSQKRVVELSGEAYFEVAHDKARPFEVITRNQTIKVLGTSFNVTGYPNEAIISTLLEGEIQIQTDLIETARLLPGTQAIYDPQKQQLIKKQVNVEHFTAWKDGLFYFQDKELEHIMEVLARWYKIEVVYKNKQKKNIRFTGTLKRYSSFKEIVNLIEMTGDVKFSINDNNTVIIE